MNLIFDIGCNTGEFYSKCFEAYPGCKVIAIDANKDLIANASLRENLILVHSLVSNKKEEVDFYIDHYQTGISTASEDYMGSSRFAKGSKHLKPYSGCWTRPVKVLSTTLDDLIEQYGSPDYIKIDVEGYEYEVLQGLSKKQNIISFEWHEEGLDVLNNCVNHLLGLGYEKFGICAYLDEGDVFEGITYDKGGDSYLKEPEDFYSWDVLKGFLYKSVNPDRRVNYGMFTAIQG